MNNVKTGEFITQMRLDRGLSIEQLATRIGISKECLAAYEHGTAKIRSDVIIQLGKEFGCGALSVMRGTYPPDNPHILRR